MKQRFNHSEREEHFRQLHGIKALYCFHCGCLQLRYRAFTRPNPFYKRQLKKKKKVRKQEQYALWYLKTIFRDRPSTPKNHEQRITQIPGAAEHQSRCTAELILQSAVYITYPRHACNLSGRTTQTSDCKVDTNTVKVTAISDMALQPTQATSYTKSTT